MRENSCKSVFQLILGRWNKRMAKHHDYNSCKICTRHWNTAIPWLPRNLSFISM